MSFHKQGFAQRFHTMGDPAEAAFDRVFPKHHKLGLNRPPLSMQKMTLAQRYTPDRMLAEAIVECMGFGRDRLLKLKDEKVEALTTWESIGPVQLFVYDQTAQAYYLAPLQAWTGQLSTHGIARTFENDGKSYRELHADHFPTDPTPLPPEA